MQWSIVARYTGATVQFSSLSECDKAESMDWRTVLVSHHIQHTCTLFPHAFENRLWSSGFPVPWPLLDLQAMQSRLGFFLAALAGMGTGQCLDLLNSRRSKLQLSALNRPGLAGLLIPPASILKLTSCSITSFTKLRCLIYFTCLQYSMKALLLFF